ncbi:hypothetical protein BSZ14_00080 [Sphingomonas sp. Sph1(2015)]|jgi:hypothetical protein|uniref:hypothetical protein n=1 Tax=Sphingomonas sp. Sph1(2015) TaxID=1628084 RepID=UPI0009768C2E|nr:hypothetical protein [Sphingomonas sp. Sph1(2015)]OMJ33874.1 hypothetical protein BSZ14_00080 [Sphingomonas sp. Sph1(2015)]
MMLLALLMLSADPATPPSTMPGIGQAQEHCVQKETRVSQSEAFAGPRKLNEMPNAEAQFAVVRQMDGCPVAAVVPTKAKRH